MDYKDFLHKNWKIMNNSDSNGTIVCPLQKPPMNISKSKSVSVFNHDILPTHTGSQRNIHPVVMQLRNSSKKDLTDCQTRLPSSTRTFNIPEGNVRTLYNTNSIRQYLRRILIDLRVINVVYAMEQSSFGGSDNEQKTTLERLLEGKRVLSENHVTDAEIRQFIENQSGLDRVKLLFSGVDTAYGKMQHPDMTFSLSILKTVMTAMFLIGSVGTAYTIRARRTQARSTGQYDTKEAAKVRQLQSKLVNEAFFGGVRMSLKGAVGVVVTMAALVGISAYRNKTGIVEGSVAGGSIGALSVIRESRDLILKNAGVGLIVGIGLGYLLMMEKQRSNCTQEQQNYLIVQQLLEFKKINRRSEDI